ncbi:MAG: type II secretion system F family protein [bacterium]|nr:type II secretion system F family protein [bacterium]
MPVFDYKAKASDNRPVQGIVEAKNKDAAGDILLERGLVIISIKPRASSDFFAERVMSIFNKVSKKDLAIMLRQLSILISSAIPLVQAIKMLVEQTQKRILKEALLNMSNDVEAGTKFSDALAGYPRIFKPFFVNMIKSGETTGKLDDILTYLADQQEKDYELESRIKGAMLYPAFIVTALVGVGIFVMVYVMPRMLEMFKEFDPSKLPVATKILITVTAFSQNYWYIVILVLAAIIGSWMWYIRTPGGRFFWGSAQVRIPAFGSLFRNIYIVRMSRTFATVLVGGLTVTEGLAIVRDVVGNAAYQAVLTDTIKGVEDGNPIANTMKHHPNLFPSMVPQMLSVGEETGRLEDVLDKITDFYTREINVTISNILVIIEPVIIVLLGVGVMIMVAGVLLPMYQLASQF